VCDDDDDVTRCVRDDDDAALVAVAHLSAADLQWLRRWITLGGGMAGAQNGAYLASLASSAFLPLSSCCADAAFLCGGTDGAAAGGVIGEK
jgi:hypothetical protein